VLLEAGTDLVLTVTDDGKGLPEGVAESGLGNMRLRAQRHNGEFSIESAPGEGTRLRWTVPVRSD